MDEIWCDGQFPFREVSLYHVFVGTHLLSFTPSEIYYPTLDLLSHGLAVPCRVSGLRFDGALIEEKLKLADVYFNYMVYINYCEFIGNSFDLDS